MKALVFLLPLVVGLASAAESPRRPDIVLIIADDMGYSDLGCYGGEIDTPRLDALAKAGVRFSNFYVNNMCWPTRASLMTSFYPGVALPVKGSAEGGLHPDAVTLPEVLRSAGYRTYMAGKWHLSDPVELDGSNAPHHKGFNRFYGTLLGAGSFFAPASLALDGEDASAEFRDDPDYYYTDALTDHALGFLRDHFAGDVKTEEAPPFFLYLSYTAAHWPLHARPEDIARYQGRFAAGWDALREKRHARMKALGVVDPSWKLSPRHPDVPAWEDADDRDWQQRRMEVYAAQVTRMDRSIGRVIDFLKQSGRHDDTLILYMQDNGACHVEYGVDRKGAYLPEKTRDGRPLRPGNIPGLMPGPEDTYQSYGYGWANLSNTPFRLFKQYDHEGGTRSPLIVSWPRRIAENSVEGPGSIVPELCHAIDLLPTLAEAAGVDPTATFADGRKALSGKGFSFLPVLGGDHGARPADEALFWSHAKGAAVRRGDDKLVRVKGEPWRLYDLARDGTELNDLAAKRPERVAELETLFREWAASNLPKPAKKKRNKNQAKPGNRN